MGWATSGFILMVSPFISLRRIEEKMVIIVIPCSPSSPLHWWLKKQYPNKMGKLHDNGKWKTSLDIGSTESRRREKKAPVGQKSEEQNKRRVQEMTSHSPLFPLPPQVVTGNSEWMSRHHGVCTYSMFTTAVAGSLHRHDVLDKGCRRGTERHTDRTRDGKWGSDEKSSQRREWATSNYKHVGSATNVACKY